MSEATISRRTFLRRSTEIAVAGATLALGSLPQLAHAERVLGEKTEYEHATAERKIPIGVNMFDGIFDPNFREKLARLKDDHISLVRIIAANKNYPMTRNSEMVHRYIVAANQIGISVSVMFMNHYGDQGHYPKEVDFRFFTQGDETPQLDQSFYKNMDRNKFPEFVEQVVTDNMKHPNLHSWQLINEARTKKPLLLNFVDEINKLIRAKDPRTKIFSGILSTANTGTNAEELYGKVPGLHVNGNSYDNEKVAELLRDAYWATKNGRHMSITELGYEIGKENRARAFVDGIDLWENAGVDSVFLWGLQSHRLPPDERYGLTPDELKKIMRLYKKAA